MNINSSPTLVQKLLAWLVHAFTASGLVVGFLALLAINVQDWRKAMSYLLLALLIDGIDGTFARVFRVTDVLPNVNGKNIDYVIDFANYAIIPAYFFFQAELVPPPWQFPCTVIILMVSALYYGLDGMVSEDQYFVGFPVLWNMVIFYMVFVFKPAPLWNVVWVIVFAVLHFLPIKFVYPSRGIRFRTLTLVSTVIFFLSLGGILYLYPATNQWLTACAILTAVYFGAMAVYNTWLEN